MSKGPGRVQLIISNAFARNPDRAYTTEELCEMVYGKIAQAKKHRVAVLRAVKSVADIDSVRGEHGAQSAIFFNHRSLLAYATARIRAESYQWDPLSHAEASRILREDNRYAKLIQEGEAWWVFVQEWVSEKDNNPALKEKLKPLIAARERGFAAFTEQVAKLLGES